MYNVKGVGGLVIFYLFKIPVEVIKKCLKCATGLQYVSFFWPNDIAS
jgi:hypothetical protein